jgi:hypothetical protein
MRMTAAAPSEIAEELAAVTVPSLAKAGFSVGMRATSARNGSSSRSTSVSPARPFTVTGVISALNCPPLQAASARRTDSVANASCAARVKPYLRAVCSAKWPIMLPS